MPSEIQSKLIKVLIITSISIELGKGRHFAEFILWKVFLSVDWKPSLTDRSIPAILFSRLSAPFGGKSCSWSCFTHPTVAAQISWQLKKISHPRPKGNFFHISASKIWYFCGWETKGSVALRAAALSTLARLAECRQEAPVCFSPIHLLTTAAGTICYTQEHKYTNAEVHQYKNTKIQKNTKYFIITAKMSHYAHQSTY